MVLAVTLKKRTGESLPFHFLQRRETVTQWGSAGGGGFPLSQEHLLMGIFGCRNRTSKAPDISWVESRDVR